MPKILPKANTIEIRWLAELRNVAPGEELYLLVANKKEQTQRIKTFRELLAKLDRDDPVFASSITITPTHRDHKLWVMLKVSEESPLIGYVKGADGTVSRVDVDLDPSRERRIKLMYKDGYTISEMSEELDYPPTPEEIRKMKRTKR